MARGKIIFPIADGVEDLEYWVTRMRLEEEGYEVASAGLTKADVVGKNGLVIPVDLLLSEIDSSALLALVLAGGWAPDKLRRYSVVTDLIATANKEGNFITVNQTTTTITDHPSTVTTTVTTPITTTTTITPTTTTVDANGNVIGTSEGTPASTDSTVNQVVTSTQDVNTYTSTVEHASESVDISGGNGAHNNAIVKP
ncbi:MAG: hypothetical protein EBV22_05090, partial [Actinobacteria bacterium]|nr:hypothetical protein [Actinomycetota bacterium]